MSDKLTTYVVKNGDSKERLVQADGKAQVRAHLLKPMTIEYASQGDLIRLLGAGVKVEVAENGAGE